MTEKNPYIRRMSFTFFNVKMRFEPNSNYIKNDETEVILWMS